MRDESAAMNHPETGLLAAFANRALTAEERASLLIHLGECARCRDVVFLAQRSALSAEPEKSVTPHVWQKRSIFTLVTAGLAACLLVIGTIARMHLHGNRSPGSETAALQPLPAPSPVVASPPAITRPPESTHRKPPLPIPAEIVPRYPSIPSGGANYDTGISIPQISAREMENQPPPPEARISPEQAEAQRRMWLRERAAEQALVQKPEQANSSSQAPGAPVAEPVLTGVPAVSSTGQVKVPNASPDNASQSTSPAVSMRPQAAAEPELHLPSGLAASSRIEIRGRILVLDTAGALFASDDRGQHWRKMKTPWLGRAHELVGFPPLVAPAAGGTDGQSSAAAQSGKTPSAPAYNVVMAFCADGERWMSLDRGQTWRPASPNR